MKYEVTFSKSAIKDFAKLDKYTQKMLYNWISKNLIDVEDPRQKGKALSANRAGQWRYRVGDYRIIAEIQDNRLIILIIAIGHRKDIYDL